MHNDDNHEIEKQSMVPPESVDEEATSITNVFKQEESEEDSEQPQDGEKFEDLLVEDDGADLVERFFDEDDDNFDSAGTHGQLGEGDELPINYERLPLKTEIEACLFASPSPLKIEEIMGLCSYDEPKSTYFEIIAEIQQQFEERQSGFKLKDLKTLGFQFQTEESSGYVMAKMFSQRPKPISKAALETLAIIAYRQPCTRAVVEYIRGVDSGSIIKNLMDRNLIRCVGRREDAGRPMLFGTTDEFLNVFDLRSLGDLPSLGSFQANSDTLKKALEDLEQLEEVDVDSFVSDENEPQPEVSGGLLDDEESMVSFESEPSSAEAVNLASSAVVEFASPLDMSENET